MNPTVDQRVIMLRIAKKIERAAERMGWMPSTVTQAVLRCNGRVVFKATQSEVQPLPWKENAS